MEDRAHPHVGVQEMSGPGLFQKVFPREYHPAVWAPGALLIAAFLTIEKTLHRRHAELNTPPAFEAPAGWEALYYLGFLWYAAPLVSSYLRTGPGRLRRTLVGFGLQLGAGLALAALPLKFDLFPCLQVASALFILLLARMTAPVLLQLAAAAVLGAVSAATLVTQRHDWLDVALGLFLGAVTYRLAFARDLGFLEQPYPWRGIVFHLRDLRNLFIGNAREHWEATYAAGQWDFLGSVDQRPRHYAITGLVADRFSKGSRVLDVGCGHGALWELLRATPASYLGLDLSAEAVERCRKQFGWNTHCRFEQGSFEDFATEERFEVVVLNEVLYYFPLAQAESVVDKALGLLRPGGMLIVSMNNNPKAALVWSKLAALRAEQSLRVSNVKTGSCWTINVYGGKNDARS